MSHSVVRFPPPPPTSNNLTPKQRAHLMRSSKKLSQVLGSTPHVLDWAGSPAPSHVDTPSRSTSVQSHSASIAHRRSKSSPHADRNPASERSTPRPSSRPSTANSSQSHTSTISHASSSSSRGEQAWRTPYDPLHRPPLLKLRPPEPSNHGQRNSTYSDCGSEVGLPDSPTAPSFALPSEAAIRRAKMQRLTRKLGDGVPPELVFPTTKPEPDDEDDEDSPVLKTPASDRKLPFSQALPTIPERRPDTVGSHIHVEVTDRRAQRNAIYVIESPDEHGVGDGWNLVCVGDPTAKHGGADRYTELSPKREGAKEGEVVCLGVAASAGPVGQGRSGRWVRGPVTLDQIASPAWRGGAW
ncbi:hypothetical protein DAEQUDRAFT_666658 [Daedalea quercina L-15889]|uniref:Uncharacterized protein n=1 Tax=Daedalea quercina L-15889 TaxID=1314783 RepID=A0A165RV52_9APHY|nr:hypothetical protein DAEQUDRAFT_666658 [Daedalea quercina L-15889]